MFLEHTNCKILSQAISIRPYGLYLGPEKLSLPLSKAMVVFLRGLLLPGPILKSAWSLNNRVGALLNWCVRENLVRSSFEHPSESGVHNNIDLSVW